MQHFNGLSPAEAERLAMLAEEAAEVIQIVGKILRHGYGSFHPENNVEDNRDMLDNELRDFAAVYGEMQQRGDVPVLSGGLDERWTKKLRYSHHQ